RGSHAIINSPRRYNHSQEQPQGIHDKMPLATIDLLRPIIPVFATQLGRLHRLTIHTSGTGSRFPHALLPRSLGCALPDLGAEGIHNPLPQTMIAVFGEIIVNRTLG